ncbi:hypothetical protein VKT23_010592 [Stygiomarasmius scandens]|uniref:Glucose-methanol-choline oxidoreductase N-terminal domain-containing protein n=1 Tax=Marasmiellus scandens TaxID=2682957 RepID=A0ABR1JBM3_9AGAR
MLIRISLLLITTSSNDALVLTALLSSAVTARPSSHVHQQRNNNGANILSQGSQISNSYDFVVVGGGMAGLALASRLSENSSTTVLVLEAGQSGDAVANQINEPANTYYNSLLNTDYDWAYKTSAQSSMNNRQLSWPRGKVLGGSSAVNGMYLVRPNQVEIDAWASLASSDSSSSSSDSPWAWNSFYSAMKKVDAPSDDIASEAEIEFNQASYGDSGSIHWGYVS